MRRRDPEVEAERLAVEVNGVQRPFARRGLVAASDADDVVTKTALNGQQHIFGICRRCRKLGSGWQRQVAAAILELPIDSVLLDNLPYPASPTGKGAARRTEPHRVAARQPAQPRRAGRAGTLRSRPSCRWTVRLLRFDDDAEGHVVGAAPLRPWQRCARRTLRRWLEGTNYTDAGVVLLVAMVLSGQCGPSFRPYGPDPIGDDLGLVLFGDSGRTKGTAEPWAWLDLPTLNRRARRARVPRDGHRPLAADRRSPRPLRSGARPYGYMLVDSDVAHPNPAKQQEGDVAPARARPDHGAGDRSHLRPLPGERLGHGAIATELNAAGIVCPFAPRPCPQQPPCRRRRGVRTAPPCEPS